jgi:hypothetical protein
LKRKLVQERMQATQFTPETAREAARRRDHPEDRLASWDAHPSEPEPGPEDRGGRVSHEIAGLVGVSSATVERVMYILDNAPKEMVEALRRGHEESDKPIGVRSVYEQLLPLRKTNLSP